MTERLVLFTEPGIGENCLHCQTTLQLPNIPENIFRDGKHWGYTHPNCTAPYLLKAMLLFPLRNYEKVA